MSILNKIKKNKILVGIMGLGYVGLSNAILINNKRFKVIGFDINNEKIKKLNNYISYVEDISSTDLKNYSKRSIFTSDFRLLKDCDIVIISVPTPLTKNFKPDLSFVKNAIRKIKKIKPQKKIIILESTSYPGTTSEFFSSKVFNNSHIIFSPERINPGTNYNNESITKIIGSDKKNSLKLACFFYKKIYKNIYECKSTKAAEMIKLFENTFRAINIAYINEIKDISNNFGIDIWEVINGAKTKPFGFMPFYPSIGVGGHCIPVDPQYLLWKIKKSNFKSPIISTSMKRLHLIKNESFLKIKKLIRKNSKILILGVSYKKNISDTRESPAVYIIKKLINNGFKVDFHDPHVSTILNKGLKSIDLSAKNLKKYANVLIFTPHDKINFNFVLKHSKKIIDPLNLFKKNKKVINL